MKVSPGFDGKRCYPCNFVFHSVHGSHICPPTARIRCRRRQRVIKCPRTTLRRNVAASFAGGEKAGLVSESSHACCFVVQLSPKSIDVGFYPSEYLRRPARGGGSVETRQDHEAYPSIESVWRRDARGRIAFHGCTSHAPRRRGHTTAGHIVRVPLQLGDNMRTLCGWIANRIKRRRSRGHSEVFAGESTGRRVLKPLSPLVSWPRVSPKFDTKCFL